MPSLTTDRGTIWLADQRRDDAPYPPLLLIHGAGGTHLDWAATLRQLNSLVPDLPGHGKSPGPGRTLIADYAADMHALLDALALSQAVLVGHSMGGAIALHLALTYPERVRGLVLIGTGAKLGVAPQIRDPLPDQPEVVATLLRDWLWSSTTPDAVRQATYDLFMQVNPQVVLGDYAACQAFDLRDRLAEITAPTLVITGSEDRLTPPRYGEYLAEHLPQATLVSIAGGGHMMTLEQPQRVAAAVRNWLIARF